MSKSEWTDETIEKLLKQMPTISDSRDSRDLYLNIVTKVNNKKRVNWVIPSLVSIAAMILLVIIAPNLGWNNPNNIESKQDMNMQDSAQSSKDSKTNSETLKMVQERSSESDRSLKNGNEEMLRTAVYQEDLIGKELLTFGIPDRNAQNIAPISILVNKDETKNWFQLLIETMPKLTEEEWGLSDYYPLKGTLTFYSEKKQVNLDLPSDHQYGWGSTNEIILKNSLMTTFRNRTDLNFITFTTDNVPGVILGNDDLHQLDLNSSIGGAHPYFLFYTEGRSSPLLVPTLEPVTSLDEAFVVMREGIPTYGLRPTIPDELKIEKLVPNQDSLTIFINKGFEVPQTAEMIHSLEAILLTAKEFGFKTVEIKNANIDNIGPFRLDKAIEVPLAANRREI